MFVVLLTSLMYIVIVIFQFDNVIIVINVIFGKTSTEKRRSFNTHWVFHITHLIANCIHNHEHVVRVVSTKVGKGWQNKRLPQSIYYLSI